MTEHGIDGEVVVADNGSTDGSQEIARRAGASVLQVTARGYGNALAAGIAAARGKFILMGGADDSYDFSELPRFIGPLQQGYDLVQGCRLPSGGGTIIPGAMPPLHRWWGNPMFSLLQQPGIGEYLVPGSPLEFSALGRLPPTRAPVLGEHTDQVLAELLGLSDTEIGRLHDAGVVAGPTVATSA